MDAPQDAPSSTPTPRPPQPATQPPPASSPKASPSHDPSPIPDETNPSSPRSTSPTPPRPPFSPLFTLIHDPSSSAGAVHPRNTHYIFSDDDIGAVLAPTCARAATHGTSTSPSSSSNPGISNADQSPNPPERILLIDLDAAGTSVARATSLDPSWGVLAAGIESSPTLHDASAPAPSPSPGRGAMLRIEGCGSRLVSPASASVAMIAAGGRGVEWGAKGDRGEGGGDESGGEEREGELGGDGNGTGIDIESEAMRALISDFERRMDVLRRVAVGEAGKVVAGEREEDKGDVVEEE